MLSTTQTSSDDIIRKTDLDFDHYGAMPEFLSQFVDMVSYLQDPAKFQINGAKLPKGILLYGPPGVGKTLAAEATAGQAGVPFLLLSCSSLTDKYIGETERKLRELFQYARKNSPCVLCLDEIDSLASKRFKSAPTASEHYANTVVNQLLTLLAEDNKSVVIFATTNDIDMIDDAIKRNGRFDRHIYVPLPNQIARENILKIHTQKVPLDATVSLKQLAQLSVGFTGAKLKGWVNEALILATRTSATTITQDHFDASRDLIQRSSAGLAQTNLLQKQRTATHEVAHALVGHLLGKNLYKVSTLSFGKVRGYTEFLPRDETINPTLQDLLDDICTELAGRAGVTAETADNIETGNGQTCVENAIQLASKIVSEEKLDPRILVHDTIGEIGKILQEQLQRAENLLLVHNGTFKKIIGFLVERDELRREDFLCIFSGNVLPAVSPRTLSAGSYFAMPPKRARTQPVASLSKPKGKQINSPDNIEDIAMALKVDPESISMILGCTSPQDSGLNIKFKPSLTEDHLQQISQELRKNDIENVFFRAAGPGIDASIEIMREGMKNFAKYIDKCKSTIRAKL